jgi:phage terminase large subunit-like protein
MTREAAKPAGAPRARRAGASRLPGGRIKRIGDILSLDRDTRAKMIEAMTPLECAHLLHDWSFWSRPDQAPPPGDWIIWLILAGRGAGKTRAGAEAVRNWVQTYPIVNLIGATVADVRDTMVQGESGVLACCRRDERPRFLASDLRLEWPNGAVSLLFSAEEPDRLRGKQHMKLWCDELAAWRQPDAFDQALLGLRLGDKPQAIVTTTPRPSKIIKSLAADKDTIVSRGSTFDNKAHLARAFFERITGRYRGQTIGRQELFAEIVEETPGALWTRALIERQRVQPEAAPREFAEIVVAVDPPARSGATSDECGIVVAARAESGLFYVLADLTSQGDTPGAWGARVGAAYRGFKANRVVAEINNGGDMVAEVLRQSEPHLPVRSVHATRGKYLRAEPIAAAYERGLVFHAGTFMKLEDQLCALTPDFDRRAAGFSPDRADALVWALADLLGIGRGSAGGMFEFYSGEGRTGV